MLTKDQKLKFVAENSKLLKSYKVVGIVQLSGIPDRLLQSTKNRLKDETRFIIGRKSLLTKILESDTHTKKLVKELVATSAIILSNEDPFVLYGKFRANSLRLAAKPGQISPEDVSVTAGETGIQPGQTVTDLKSAGIDVQIQKGKVVISKDKVLVAKGEAVSLKISKALHILDILPFKAVIEPSALLSGGMVYNRAVLGINTESTVQEISLCFRSALAVSLEAGIVNAYTINTLIERAYNSAMHLGIECKIYDSGIIDMLLADAAMQATSLNSMGEVKEEVKE
ncbi:MAG: 50S ribosomal protein L10 [Candidatus Micrarchaeaceae archaeon]|jgi:large subunit ribosomal protein L10|nr:50S ribosomal protein L10 [Candidatus Micrarchaeota archaeon]